MINMTKFKDTNLTPREKALLAILISEIEGCPDVGSIAAVTQSWVKANDLHPEKVGVLNQEELKAFILRTTK